MPVYRERLWPPPTLLISLLLLIPATLLVFVPINPEAGAVIAIVLYVACVGALIAMSSRITVDESGLAVGAAALPATALGEIAVFVGDEARAERGVRLDARAWLGLRGGISPVVRVEVSDEHDPTPYWLISTRRPAELAKALQSVRGKQ